MNTTNRVERKLAGAAAVAGLAAFSYAAFSAAAWTRYGHASKPARDEADQWLDLFMPVYEVVERHHIRVDAPVHLTFGAFMDMDLQESTVVRAIFKARELLLGGTRDAPARPRSLVEITKELGWVALAEVPGHEIVMGAVTRPWDADVVFRSIPAEHFAAFNEPGYVKIAWTLRADAYDGDRSVARSETRAVATDEVARRKFRWYWARFSAGIVLIRQLSMRLVKQKAERMAYTDTAATRAAVTQPK